MSEAKKIDAGGFLAPVLSHPGPLARSLADQMDESELDAVLSLRDETVKRANVILANAASRREKGEAAKVKAEAEAETKAEEPAEETTQEPEKA